MSYEDVEKNCKTIEDIVKDELELVKDPKWIFLGGFSQGAIMTANYVFENERTFGGLIAFSGCLLPNTKINNKSTPTFVSHGEYD